MPNKATDGLYNAQNTVARKVNESLGNHALEGPRCCFCMPIKPGIVFIYLYITMDLIQSVIVTIGCYDIH